MKAWLISLAACLGLTGACKPDEQREPQANTDARADTQGPRGGQEQRIVNDAYRFSVGLPGPGWRQLDEQTARRLNPIAAVTVADAKGGTGTVTVEAMPGATVESVTQILWSPELFPGQLESESELEYQGQPAKRRIYRLEVRNAEVRVVHTVFVHRDHVYQVISGQAASLDLELPMRFQDSFELLESTRSLPELPATSEAEGAFIDHQYGVSLRPPPGFEREDSATEGIERRVRWSRGEHDLELEVMVSSEPRDPEALLDLYALALNASGGIQFEPVEHDELMLDGRKARQLRSPDHRLRVDLVAFEGIVYALTSRNLSDEELAAARAGLRFLE